MHLKSLDNPDLNILVNDAFWGDFLVQMMNLGWSPEGTYLDNESKEGEASKADIEGWDSTNYFTSDGQIFKESDLESLINTIEENENEVEEFLEGPEEAAENDIDLIEFLKQAKEIRID